MRGFGFKLTRTACEAMTLVLVFMSWGYGHGTDQHADITTKAIGNYIQWACTNLDGPPGSGGTDALGRYGGLVVQGSRDEDSMWPDPAPWRQHYMDPVTGDGVTCAGIRFKSAFKRVLDENHWPYALAAYRAGEYADAFWTLGRIVHLVEDMGVPAHVQLDVHFVHEWYEKDYIPSRFVTCTDITIFGDPLGLRPVMWALAEKADEFDSDGDGTIVKGTTNRINANDGWTENEGRAIADDCYVGAINAAGNVLLKFFATVEPRAELVQPQGQSTRMDAGVRLEAKASSFGRDFADTRCIDRVEFYYCTTDTPQPQNWLATGAQAILTSGTTGSSYKGVWQNATNEGRVHVRAVVYDKGGCRSRLINPQCVGVTTIYRDNP